MRSLTRSPASRPAMRRGRRTRSHQRFREGSSMGQKTVRFSDLSGQLIMHDDALARIVVQEHPELGDGPVEIEVLTEEAENMEDATLRVAVIDLYLPDDIEPLATQGLRTISLTDAEHVERYDLHDLARERNMELEFGIEGETEIEDDIKAKKVA